MINRMKAAIEGQLLILSWEVCSYGHLGAYPLQHVDFGQLDFDLVVVLEMFP